MTTLADRLVSWANLSQDLAWSRFKLVTTHAARFGLTAADVDRWANPGEPAFVAHLVSDEANRFLRHAIACHAVAPWQPDTVAVSSVFIHQKPKVDFGRGQIEIGDLLLVRQHFILGNPFPQGSAFLLQAKTSSSPATGRLKGNEAVQFELYRDWPAITFPSYPNWLPKGSPSWDFHEPPYSERTGLYGVVYPKELRHLTSHRRKLRFADDCAWGVGTQAQFGVSAGFGTVDASKLSLGRFMEGFINGRLGRPWAVHRGDHWSQFVVQVMERAANELWTYPVQRAGVRWRRRFQPGKPLAVSMGMAYAGAFLEDFECGPYFDTRLALEQWLDSVEPLSSGDGNEYPPEDPDEEAPQGGLSLVYVGTFGDRPLENLPTD